MTEEKDIPEGAEFWPGAIQGVVFLADPVRVRVYYNTEVGFDERTQVYRESVDMANWGDPVPITVTNAPTGSIEHEIKIVLHDGVWYGAGHGPGDSMNRYESNNGVNWFYHSEAYNWRLDGEHNFFFNPVEDRWEWYGRVRGEQTSGQPGRWNTVPYDRRGISRHTANDFFGAWTSEIFADPLDFFNYEDSLNPAPSADQTTGYDFFAPSMFWDADENKVKGFTSVFFRDPDRGAKDYQDEEGRNTRWTGPIHPVQTSIVADALVIDSLSASFPIALHKRISDFYWPSAPDESEVGQIIAFPGVHTFKGKNYIFYYLRNNTRYERRMDAKHEASVFVLPLDGETGFENVADDDTVFTGELTGPLTVPVAFSVNNPAVVKNLPLGTWNLSEDTKDGYSLIEKSPFEVVLTESEPEGVFLVKNQKGEGHPPPRSSNIIYLLGEDSTEDNNTIISKQQYSASGMIGSVVHAYFSETTHDFPFSNSVRQHMVVLISGEVVVSTWQTADPGKRGLWLFDSDLNFLDYTEFDFWNNGVANPAIWGRMCRTRDDGFIVAQSLAQTSGFTGNVRFRKYDRHLNLIWISDTIGHTGSPGAMSQNANTIVGGYLVTVNANDANSFVYVHTFDAETGDHIDELRLSVPMGNNNISSVTAVSDTQFVVTHRRGYALMDVDLNVIDTAVWEDFPGIGLTGTPPQVDGTRAEISSFEDGSFTLDHSNNNRNFRINPSEKTLIYSASTSLPASNFRIDGQNRLVAARLPGGGRAFGIYNGDTGVTIHTAGNMSPVPDDMGESGQIAQYYSDWWVFEMSTPPPPTGDASVTFQKEIQNSDDPADDDIEFIFNLYGPANYFTRKVSVNDPLTISNLPYGQYSVQESGVNTQYPPVGIEPREFTLTEENSPLTVVITNRKAGASGDFVTGTLRIVDILESAPAVQADFDFRFAIRSTGTGVIEVANNNVPGNLVLVAYDTSVDSIQTIVSNLREAINGASGGPRIIDSDWDDPVTASSAGQGDILRLRHDVAGSIGNTFQVRIVYSADIEVNGNASGLFTQNLTGGEDSDPNFIELYYPYAGSFNNIPKVSITYTDEESPETVASRLAQAVNDHPTINLEAARIGDTITFTEKRQGTQYAGNRIRVLTNGQTIIINPTNGIITMG